MVINEIQYHNDRFERVWQTEKAESQLIKELDDTLSNNIPHTYYQTPWMGRGCFKPHNNSFMFLKGVGPTEGSERFRKIMDLFWAKRSSIDKGGCVRLNTPDFPILIEYFYKSEDEIELFDPRPEGYSIFGAVLREAIISDFLEKHGLLIPKAIAVYKTILKPIWKNNDREAMGQYCLDAFRKKMKLPVPIKVNLSKVQYEDAMAGALVRLLKSSVRLQEIVEVYIHHIDELHAFSATLDKDAKTHGFECWTRMLEHGLMINLIGMLKCGIIHSNLQTHYQNFSLCGEVCDWDAAIIHSDFADAEAFKKKLYALEKEYTADMMKFYEMDEAMHSDYCTYAIQQIYAILNCCMFARKIRSEAMGRPYSSEKVYKDEAELVETLYSLSDDVVREQLKSLSNVADECEYVFNVVGRTSIYGWNCYDRDKDYSKHICTEKNRRLIIEDVKKMMYLIKTI